MVTAPGFTPNHNATDTNHDERSMYQFKNPMAHEAYRGLIYLTFVLLVLNINKILHCPPVITGPLELHEWCLYRIAHMTLSFPLNNKLRPLNYSK